MLPKKQRIRTKQEFEALFIAGRAVWKDDIKIRFKKNGLKIARFGFIISNKISKKATVRNKLRRQLMSIVALNKGKFIQNVDVVVQVRPQIINKSFVEIQKSFEELLSRAKII